MANEKRLIDANALIERLKFKRTISEVGLHRGLQSAMSQVEKAHTVDAVEVVHGRWEDVWGGKYSNKKYRCSVCSGKALYDTKRDVLGNWSAEQKLTPICPYCGAKMEGG